MFIRGHDGMLGAEPRDPDLPPMLALPPWDGQISVTFIHKRTRVNAWASASIVEFARAYARLTLKAERERVAAASATQPVVRGGENEQEHSA
jgi:hypothetical protein